VAIGDAPRCPSLTPLDDEVWSPKIKIKSGGFVRRDAAHPDDLIEEVEAA
jgi:hypothetical protein